MDIITWSPSSRATRTSHLWSSCVSFMSPLVLAPLSHLFTLSQLPEAPPLPPLLTLLCPLTHSRRISEPGGGVPLFHLHGPSTGRPPLPPLLQALLLHVHPPLADRAAQSVSALPSQPAPARAGQLPMGPGGHAAAGHASGSRSESEAGYWREGQVRDVVGRGEEEAELSR